MQEHLQSEYGETQEATMVYDRGYMLLVKGSKNRKLYKKPFLGFPDD